jgi:hypothetical protein
LAALRSGLSRPSDRQAEKEPATVVQTGPPAMDPTPLPAPIVEESSHGVQLPHLAPPGGLGRRPHNSGPLPPPPGPRKTLLGIPPTIMPGPAPGGDKEPPRLPGVPGMPGDPSEPPLRRLEGVSLPGTPKTAPEDEASTQRVERFDASDILDTTPPPLPPSPGTDGAEAFFENVPTRPAAVTDLASTLEGTRPSGHVLIPKVPSAPPIVNDDSEPYLRPPGIAKGIFALGIAAAFAVGLTAGALIFRSGGGGGGALEASAPPPAAAPTPAPALASVPCPSPPPVVVAPPAAAPDAAEPDAGAPIAAAAPVSTCSLDVTSVPPGAQVFVDGKSLGPSPAHVDALPCGSVTVKVDHERYAEWKEKIELTADKPGTVAATLRRGTSKVTITSAPSGAKVYIGGRAVGNTPLTRDFPAFTRVKVQLAAPGFRPAVKYVYSKDRATKVAVTLVKDGKRR